jgi:hypothetical protein
LNVQTCALLLDGADLDQLLHDARHVRVLVFEFSKMFESTFISIFDFQVFKPARCCSTARISTSSFMTLATYVYWCLNF